MQHKQVLFFILLLFLCINTYTQVERDLNDFMSLGRDSIVGCAKHELMWRYKKIGLNINCYSRIEVLAGIEDGKEALYVNFDNPIRLREMCNPDRIGINILSGQSYYSGRGNMESFFCTSGSSMMNDFLSCLGKAQTGGDLIALPGPNSPVTSYVDVADFGDHYGIMIYFGANCIRYRLEKSDSSLEEISRNVVDYTGDNHPELKELE